MKLKNYLRTKLPTLFLLGLVLGMTSCGSYQYVGQDTDGIYGEDNEQVAIVEQENNETTADGNYYKDYFKAKSIEMEAVTQEDTVEEEVFVDIDSYESGYNDENARGQSYGAWGDNGTEISINVYNNGFGYNNYWNRPYYGWNAWGWNRPYWNVGFGFGYGHYYSGYHYGGLYDPFWASPYGVYGGYGYGYGYPYHHGYYGRGLVYNSTRRGALYGRTSALNRRVDASRMRNNATSTRTRTSTRPRVRTTSTPRTNSSTRSNTRTRQQATNPRVRNTKPRTRTSTPRTRTSTPRTRTSTPRSNTRATTPRSNSSTRSSGSSSRSSGTSSSRRSTGGSRTRG